MAKLFFHYAAMNAGKSTILLQAAYNYTEQGMKPLLITARVDDRAGQGMIGSRIGLQSEALVFDPQTNMKQLIRASGEGYACVFVDEAQFLTEAQVWQLSDVVDEDNLPVMAYGLRTDFQGKLFPGSAALLSIADEMREIRTICFCGRKATMVARVDAEGKAIKDGDQVQIGGNDSYVSLCRRHWKEMMESAE